MPEASPSPQWYIVQQPTGECTLEPELPTDLSLADTPHWGPFPTKADAIARRVGLIRAGKCRPV